MSVINEVEATNIDMPKNSAERLIDNLLSNAIKYYNVEGEIMISLKNNVLKVSDKGISVDKKIQADFLNATTVETMSVVVLV